MAPLLGVLLSIALAPGVVHAGGFEYGTPGARSLGRGGADVAGVDTPFALHLNPANLTRLGGRVRVAADVNLGIYDICMRREIAEDPAVYRPANEAQSAVLEDGRYMLPTVCNGARPSIVPNIGVSIPIIENRLTLGAGLVVPVSSQVQSYGPSNGRYFSETQMDFLPTPTRYMIISQDLLQVFPTIGIGYSPIDQLRLGFAFGWGITHARFKNAAYDAPLRADAPSYLDAVDGFVPRITASVSATPVRGLDLGAAFTWTSDVRASGDVTIHFNGADDRTTASLRSPQTWNLMLGARFASLLDEPVDAIRDRLSSERWDIEMNLGIIGSSRVDEFAVGFPEGATLFGGLVHLPDALRIPHNWKNQYVVRIGGDYNPIPGLLGLRAGLSYESHGVKRGFEMIDFLPFQRVGIHLGATLRIAHRFDLSIAYAHLFQQTIDNRGSYCVPDPANPPTTPRCLPRPTPEENPDPATTAIANAGRIESSVNLLSLQLGYAF